MPTDHTITANDVEQGLLQRAAAAKHMTVRGFIRWCVFGPLKMARGREIAASIASERDPTKLGTLLDENDVIMDELRQGVLPADDPDRLPILEVDQPDLPTLDPAP